MKTKHIINKNDSNYKLHIYIHDSYGVTLIPTIWWHVRNGFGSQIISISFIRWHLVINWVKWKNYEKEG